MLSLHRILATVAFLPALTLAAGLAVAQPPEVRARPLSELAEPSSYSAPAQVLAPNDALIAAEVTARVLRIGADAGASVGRSELLVELDATDLRLVLAQADAMVASAKARIALAAQRLKRAQELGEKSYVSADEQLALSTGKQGAEAELQVAQAQRAMAARAVEKCRVLAPFDGVVLERHAQVGALAMPGMPLLRLVDSAPPEVEARLPDADAETLTAAASPVLSIDGNTFPLRLARLSPLLDPVSRTRLARLVFAGDAASAGSSGSLHWQSASLRVPAPLLVQRGEAFGVFLIEDGRARFHAIAGAQPGRPADLALPPATPLVVEGQQALHDGMPVRLRTD